MIGYRTPGQGLPTNLAVEVVAFLSPNSPAVAVLPDVVVEQMGADFDIDVLFTYLTMFKQPGPTMDPRQKMKHDLRKRKRKVNF